MSELDAFAVEAPKSIAEQIERSQAYLEWSDDDLAEEIGYPSGRVIAMIKTGAVRLPLSKVHALATALELEPGRLMRMALNDTDPELLPSIERCMGPLTLTHAEVKLINILRERAQGKDMATMMLDPKSMVAVIVA
jgi:hypothetical protein